MRESCTSGSVRGARGNSRPYRNQAETAKALGLNVPDKLLVGTNEVIE